MSYRTLPRTAAWEVGIVPWPAPVDGADVEGALLVVDTDAGLLRLAQPVERGADLTPLLVQAAVEPAPPLEPGRPRSVRADGALAPRLQGAAAALGVKVRPARKLPLLDEAAEGLLASVSTGVPRRSKRWAPLVQRLASERPWDVVGEEVRFVFSPGASLAAGSIAVLIGEAGEQRGVVVYPTQDDWMAFEAGAAAEPFDLGGMTCWCAHLEPVDELEPDLAESLAAAGLVAEGLALNAYVLDDGNPRPFRRDEEAAAAMVTEAVLGAVAKHGATLRTQTTVVRVPTGQGLVEVLALALPDDEPEPLLLDWDHQTFSGFAQLGGEPQPILLLKMAKANVARGKRLLEGLEAISLHEVAPERVEVHGWAGAERLGVLASIECSAGHWADWQHAGGGVVGLASGGAKRQTFSARDVQILYEVNLLPSEDEPTGGDLFSEWPADPQLWPAASDVFGVWAEPLHLTTVPPDSLDEACTFGTGVWNAVIANDLFDDPALLDAAATLVRRDPDGRAVLDALVARKRRLFPHDRRLLRSVRCFREGGVLRITASWSPPND